MSKKDWLWFGCAGHFLAAASCSYHLHTQIGPYRISTIGMYLPGVRGNEFEEVGYDRLFETMVFRNSASARHVESGDDADRCPGENEVETWVEIDMQGYNFVADAHRGHMEMCEKYDRLAGVS